MPTTSFFLPYSDLRGMVATHTPQAPAAQMKPGQKTAGNWELPALTRPLAALESEGPAGGFT